MASSITPTTARRWSFPRPLALLTAALILFLTALLFRLFSAAAPPPPPTPTEMGSQAVIERFQGRLRRHPDDTYAYAQLGLAYLQRVRETADASLYALAEQAFDQALARDPDQIDAILGRGVLALTRHNFADALNWGARARALNPYSADALGILVDAQVELGRYDEAAATLQTMVNLRPGLASYSRISYLRELHGDTAGAIAAMQRAVAAGTPASEATLWVQTQLGHLYLRSGDLAQAERAYRRALWAQPDYAYALAGLARMTAAQGHYHEAIKLYEPLAARLPLPEFVIALGELYETMDRQDEAKRQYDLVRAIQRLQAGAGVDVDLELALFEADRRDDPARTLLQAQRAYERRPSLYAADVLAWALYGAGEYEQAWRYSQEALHLGTREALWHYHAGMIAYALGDRAAARRHLQQALAIDPAFSTLFAPVARALLAAIAPD